MLVVIGILIALSINNWNETRKKDDAFNAIIEQIYNVLDQESELMLNQNFFLNNQISVIDTLINKPQAFNKKLVPSLLYYVETNPNKIESAAAYQLGFLEFDPKNIEQSKLSKSLSYYVTYDKLNFSESEQHYLSSLLLNLNLPEPNLTFGLSALGNYKIIERNFFTEDQQNKVMEFISNESFQNALKSLRSQKSGFVFSVNQIISEAKVNLNLIKAYYPQVKLFYSEVGIVGDATEKGWDDTLFMTLTNPSLSIWEGDFLLKDGGLKFRCGNTWADNWGGSTFPTGRANSYANNIPVKAGKYHIILNLTEKTYQFIKQKE